MNAGDTFRFTQHDDHLWVIISDPALDAVCIILVNFTTFTADEETACILLAGDHPFIKHKTAVRYKDARAVSFDQLLTLERNCLIQWNAPVSLDVLEAIHLGVPESKYLPERCRRILEDQGLVK